MSSLHDIKHAERPEPPAGHQPYPRWKYHRTEEAVIVHSEDEEAALGEGWADTPAAFETPAVEKPKRGKK